MSNTGRASMTEHIPTKYIIYESKPNSSGAYPFASYVGTTRKSGDSATTTTEISNNTLIDINQYIVQKMNNYLNDFQLMSRCANYRKSNCSNSQNTIPSECSAFSFAANSCTTLSAYPLYTDKTKKNLQQQQADLESLLSSFNTIVSALPRGDDKTEQINVINQLNVALRDKLDSELVELKNSPFLRDNQLRLDTTIYTTSLWAILATSALYFAFMKM